ncbi:hypothetical protein K502DRAFT_301306 [Neoconidiobolus thromboides FSU 785]|nr:hypothetical protein K502DRAFT_301306 [Neoconidiobolus thromboides FSU 785]
MATFIDSITPKEARFYFLRVSKDQWCFVSYIPDGTVKIKERMLYASSKQQLKDLFGSKFILSDHHFTSVLEIKSSGEYLNRLADRMKNLKVTGEERKALLSKVELSREEAREQEDTAREEIAKALLNRGNEGGNQPNLATFNSGGFHQVAIPLFENTKQSIQKLGLGELAWIEMAVTDKKDGIEVISEKNNDQIQFWRKESLIPFPEHNEPRFYLTVIGEQYPKEVEKKEISKNVKPSTMKQHTWPIVNENNKITDEEFKDNNEEKEEDSKSDKGEIESPIEEKDELVEENNSNNEEEQEQKQEVESKIRTDLTYVLIYSCPPSSPPRLRMVYSTTVAQLITQIQKENIPLNYKIELFDNIPKFQQKFQLLYDKISNKESGGVFKLDTKLSLSHLVHSSHQQHKLDIKRDQELENLRPKFGKGLAANNGPHPLFGGIALAGMTNDRNQAKNDLFERK